MSEHKPLLSGGFSEKHRREVERIVASWPDWKRAPLGVVEYNESENRMSESTWNTGDKSNQCLAAENAALRAQLAEMRGVLEEALPDLRYLIRCLTAETTTEVEFNDYAKTRFESEIETVDKITALLGRPECAADTTGEEREGR